MRRLWIGILVASLLAAGCIGLDDSQAVDPSANEDDEANTTQTDETEPRDTESTEPASGAGADNSTETDEAGNRSVFEVDQEATLEFTHVATPLSASTRGENCLNHPEEPPVATLWGQANLTWTPTTPAFGTLQVRLFSGFDELAATQGTSPLTLEVDEVAPSGDDLTLVVDAPRDPVGLAVLQEASLSVDFTYEGTEEFRFEDGWSCTYAGSG